MLWIFNARCINVTDKWLKAIDEGKYTGAVFLDLTKAFDTIKFYSLN